jgi:hypothetical protein
MDYTTPLIVLTSQLPTKQSHNVLGEPIVADAICDRFLHDAFKIELKEIPPAGGQRGGERLRKRGNC